MAVQTYELLERLNQGRYAEYMIRKESKNKIARRVMAMSLLAATEGVIDPPHGAMIGFANLSEVVDLVLDQERVPGRVFQKISRFLLNPEQMPELDSPEEVFSFSLFQQIERSYPLLAHPQLRWVFLELHEAQLDSERLKSKLPLSELLPISLHKGGATLAATAYISLGELSREKLEFFYKTGAVMQLLDDYKDVELDLEDGIYTLFSRSHNSPDQFGKALAGMLKLQARVETEVAGLEGAFSHGRLLPDLYRVFFRAALLAGTLEQSPDRLEATEEILEELLPVPLRRIQSCVRHLARRGFGSNRERNVLGNQGSVAGRAAGSWIKD